MAKYINAELFAQELDAIAKAEMEFDCNCEEEERISEGFIDGVEFAETFARYVFPAADIVPKKENDLLEKRFKHLMESDYIAKFDMVDILTKEYIKKISEADDIQRMYGHLEICLKKFGVPLWDNNNNIRKVPDILRDLNIAFNKIVNKDR